MGVMCCVTLTCGGCDVLCDTECDMLCDTECNVLCDAPVVGIVVTAHVQGQYVMLKTFLGM